MRRILIMLAVIDVGAWPGCQEDLPPFLPGVSDVGATHDEAWDAVFTRETGWTGADGAYSVDLGDGRTLWLFSDTWVGEVEDGEHVGGSRLVNNSIAAHATSPDGEPPPWDEVVFARGPDDGEGDPTAWIAPDPERVLANGDESGGNGWYWLQDGLVAPGPDGQPRLVVMLAHIGSRSGDHGVWGFKSVGGALAIIDNPHDAIEAWSPVQHDNPHSIDADRAATGDLIETAWGNALFHERPTGGPAHGFIYVYGVQEYDAWNKRLLLARAPADRIEQFTAWEFRTASGWSAAAAEAVPVAENLVNELSVEAVSTADGTILVMVHSEPVFGDHLQLRTASAPAGPWSEPRNVYRVRDIQRHETYFTYAGKGHAPLSRPGELLVTYVLNSHDFWAMCADAEIYRPRFVRVPLTALPPG